MTDRTNYLQPCPFCGGGDLELRSPFVLLPIHNEEREHVECRKCDASAPLEVWNRREGK